MRPQDKPIAYEKPVLFYGVFRSSVETVKAVSRIRSQINGVYAKRSAIGYE